MYVEHVVWTLAVCVLVGTYYAKYPPNKNPVWLIWFAMFIPDSDFVAQTVWIQIFPYKTTTLFLHGQFHNILILTLSAVLIGWFVWKNTKIAYKDAAFCIALGFTAHLLEDALVNGSTYYFYYPFSNRGWYQGFILNPMYDVIAANTVIASTNVLFIGLLLLALAILIRSFFQGDAWLEKYDFVPFLKRTAKDIHARIPVGIADALTFYGVTADGLYEGYNIPIKNAGVTGRQNRYDLLAPVKNAVKNKVISKVQAMSLTNAKFDDEQFD